MKTTVINVPVVPGNSYVLVKNRYIETIMNNIKSKFSDVTTDANLGYLVAVDNNKTIITFKDNAKSKQLIVRVFAMSSDRDNEVTDMILGDI